MPPGALRGPCVTSGHCSAPWTNGTPDAASTAQDTGTGWGMRLRTSTHSRLPGAQQGERLQVQHAQGAHRAGGREWASRFQRRQGVRLPMGWGYRSSSFPVQFISESSQGNSFQKRDRVHTAMLFVSPLLASGHTRGRNTRIVLNWAAQALPGTKSSCAPSGWSRKPAWAPLMMHRPRADRARCPLAAGGPGRCSPASQRHGGAPPCFCDHLLSRVSARQGPRVRASADLGCSSARRSSETPTETSGRLPGPPTPADLWRVQVTLEAPGTGLPPGTAQSVSRSCTQARRALHQNSSGLAVSWEDCIGNRGTWRVGVLGPSAPEDGTLHSCRGTGGLAFGTLVETLR